MIGMVSSFDIFDTCIVRKCGTPENFFDVLSLHAFNGEVEEMTRQAFVMARLLAQQGAQSPSATLRDIWETFSWKHPLLKTKEELCQLEMATERTMLVPVLMMREKVSECRQKGHRILFISDMYIPSGFLSEVMKELGFMQENDKLYVSCECGVEKRNGSLFKYVKEKEGISYRKWHHYGDNKQNDVKAPRKLGIRATLVEHEYSSLQKLWMETDFSLGYKCSSIMAGLGRALRYSTEWTTHTDFVIDLIAPFYCSWVYKLLKNASERGIQRLYFCARDARLLYKLALRMQRLFPEIGMHYVSISRQALYNNANEKAKMAYFESIGLATKTDSVAIVDTTTSGKTLRYLNSLLSNHGCKEVISYYQFLTCFIEEGFDFDKYNTQIVTPYIRVNKNYGRLTSLVAIYECFFGLNNEKKTVDYAFADGVPCPVFTSDTQEEDTVMMSDVDWVQIHNSLVLDYSDKFFELGLDRHYDRIFETAIATLGRFFEKPSKPYLKALTEFSIIPFNETKSYPCVKKLNPMELLGKKKRDYYWRRGCIYYTLPDWLLKMHKS